MIDSILQLNPQEKETLILKEKLNKKVLNIFNTIFLFIYVDN